MLNHLLTTPILKSNLLPREILANILPFIDKPLIKIITGMRRTGKSSVLKLLIQKLQKENKIPKKQIIYINKELLVFDPIRNYHDLHKLIQNYRQKNTPNQKLYIFIDEVQLIEQWEKCINSFLADENFECDIYLTGSNATMLSNELSSLIAGRFLNFETFPLSFKEFLTFRNNQNQTQQSSEKHFTDYLRFGGLPEIHNLIWEEAYINEYLKNILDSIVLKDILNRYHVKNIYLLQRLLEFIASNLGSLFSANSLVKFLKNQKLNTKPETLLNYLEYTKNVFFLHTVKRYDIQGKQTLEFLNKYYFNDLGLKHTLFFDQSSIGKDLENLVYLELLRRGYKVNVGKWSNLEIDFIAMKEQDKIYFQVAYLLPDENTIQREFGNLLKIENDAYRKVVLSLDQQKINYKGVEHWNIIDFLEGKIEIKNTL